MNTNLQIIFLGIIIFLLFLIIFWVIKTEKRLKKFFAGKKGKDLESAIEDILQSIKKTEEDKINLNKEIQILKEKQKQNIRGLETVRFNPFPDQGSNQSFAISLINEEKNGVVISSLYGRDRMSIFAKPIKNGQSNYDLTPEEKEVLEKANEIFKK